MSMRRQLQGYRLTLAEITYRLPDHPKLLQTYFWQEFDLAPRFPVLRQFLEFWSRNLDGRLHSIRIDHAEPLAPTRLRAVHELRLH